MIKNLIESIEGVEVFGIIGLVIFFSFFVVMTIWLIKVDKNYINKMKHLPLQPDYDEISGNETESNNFAGEKNDR